ncbi:hypothetical protein EV286_1192 [Rhizobium sp. BK251]|nr:hypothetical protein EV286_1192 [Rhizobium sp. BK251]
MASLFGPAQVASRLINLVFGKELSQKWLAVIATVLLPIGLIILLMTTSWGPGAVVFPRNRVCDFGWLASHRGVVEFWPLKQTP